ncbi:MAG: DUF4268 domain-containing protein [Chitinophagaceae bacterium]|uniref:DUF4268 domain-containing protein n=1 Tax=unclassified Paraflavitalea TaxID=2798305 RepID=UPI003D34E40C|nr:DUF4268 domain-containing protein [Chitinophagaceae bacterium]
MIGKIEKVALRSIWKHEAKDFTTWLQENIDSLNQVLDFQISNVEREQSTGNFNVDLVAEDENGNPVIIENQLEKSNHDHLGKVITYLASIGAEKAIWIVSDPRQEHVKAISWLNESTAAEFYLIKIEAIKIGASDPAPLFTLIVGPSEEIREAGVTKKEYAERHHHRKSFWTFLLERAKQKTKLHANISPNIYSWVGTGSGIAGVTYNYVIGQHDAKTELYIDKDKEDGKENKELFDRLYAQKEAIEKSYGGELSWQRLDNKRASRIAKTFTGIGYKDEDNWEELADMMIDSMIRLEKAIAPFINK